MVKHKSENWNRFPTKYGDLKTIWNAIKDKNTLPVLRDNWDDEDATLVCPLFETIV